jgi:ABC-type transporter Mla MlaB component
MNLREHWRKNLIGHIAPMCTSFNADYSLNLRAFRQHVRYLLERTRASEVICDVSAVAEPDGGVVEALSRMQLTARRLGGRIRLRYVCEELRELLELSGLSEVLPCEELPLEASRESEQGEEPGGVQEERDAAQPVAGDLEDL